MRQRRPWTGDSSDAPQTTPSTPQLRTSAGTLDHPPITDRGTHAPAVASALSDDVRGRAARATVATRLARQFESTASLRGPSVSSRRVGLRAGSAGRPEGGAALW